MKLNTKQVKKLKEPPAYICDDGNPLNLSSADYAKGAEHITSLKIERQTGGLTEGSMATFLDGANSEIAKRIIAPADISQFMGFVEQALVDPSPIHYLGKFATNVIWHINNLKSVEANEYKGYLRKAIIEALNSLGYFDMLKPTNASVRDASKLATHIAKDARWADLKEVIATWEADDENVKAMFAEVNKDNESFAAHSIHGANLRHLKLSQGRYCASSAGYMRRNKLIFDIDDTFISKCERENLQLYLKAIVNSLDKSKLQASPNFPIGQIAFGCWAEGRPVFTKGSEVSFIRFES